MSSNTNDSVPKLEGDQYQEWKVAMLNHLGSKALTKYITEQAEELRNADGLDLSTRIKLMDGEEMALGRIRMGAGTSYQNVLEDCKTARAAWLKLEQHFEGKEMYNKINLLEQLLDDKLCEEGNLTENIQKFVSSKCQLVRRLKLCGLEFSNDVLVALILARLPRSFEVTRRILENDPNLTMEKVQIELAREASRRGKRQLEQSDVALIAREERVFKKPRLDTSKLTCGFCIEYKIVE